MTDPENRDPSVSIVVPTFNRRSRLERLLRALDRAYAAGDRFEVVLVVDGATDGTDEMLVALRAAYPLHILRQPNRGPAAARNRAIAAASGDVLLFLDDDVVPVDGLIERHLERHREDPFAVVIGPMVAPPDLKLAPWLVWEAVKLQKQYDAMIAGRWAPTPRQFYTANASVRRAHAMAAGGFDETFTRAEDVEFAHRLADQGLRFSFVPAAAVLHEPDRTFASWLRVPYEYGRYDVLMERDLGRSHLQFAFDEWHRRHPLNRLLPRCCVGRSRRLRLVEAALTRLITHDGPGANDRIQMALCSALYTVRYWQGVADATGLDAGIWYELDRRSAAVRHLRAAAKAPRPTG